MSSLITASSVEIQPSPASTEPNDAAPNLYASMATTAVALGFVLVLAWATLRLLKRLQQGRERSGDAAESRVQVLRSVPLGPQQRLVAARYRGREYLLGVTSGAISVIDSSVIEHSDET